MPSEDIAATKWKMIFTAQNKTAIAFGDGLSIVLYSRFKNDLLLPSSKRCGKWSSGDFKPVLEVW
jgi:hypothetical protein